MYTPTVVTAPWLITLTVPYSPIVSTKMKIEPMTMPGIVCGRITSRNVLPPVPAQVTRSLDRVPVDLREQEEDRRDHEQDVELDHRQLHG